jgi:hypothetical protein
MPFIGCDKHVLLVRIREMVLVGHPRYTKEALDLLPYTPPVEIAPLSIAARMIGSKAGPSFWNSAARASRVAVSRRERLKESNITSASGANGVKASSRGLAARRGRP